MLGDKGFDLWADGYDRDVQISDDEGVYPFAGYRDVLGRIYAAVREQGTGRLLDVGFGTGVLTKRLYDDGYAVTGIDFSQKMIALAQQKMPGARLVQADFAEGLPDAVRAERYDAIVSTYALHHLYDPGKAALLQALFGLLTPGGVLLIGDVAFETQAQQAALRERTPGWDTEECYFNADTLLPLLGVPAAYAQVSVCAGILTLRKPRMVLFDYGGTIAQEKDFDSLASAQALLAHAVENPRGVTAEEMEAFVQPLFEGLDGVRLDHRVEVHEHQFLRFTNEYLGLRFDLTPTEIETLQWDAAEPAVLQPGIDTLLDCLRAQGIRTGVISNIMYSGQALEERLHRLLPNHTFAFVIATSDYLYRKPNPLIFDLALRKADLSAQDVWYCGNSQQADVVGARGAGITPIWLTGEKSSGTCCVQSWAELTAWMGCTKI